MQVHLPLVISTACQRAGLGLLLCAVFANAVLGSQLPSNIPCLVALALLCAGGIASVFHLQRPSRFFNAFSNPKSHLTQEGFITPFLGVALIAAGLDGIAFNAGAASAGLLCIAAVLALAFLVCTGLAYQMKSRPAWSTKLVFALFLLTAVAAGFMGAYALALLEGDEAANKILACGLAATIAAAAVQTAYVSRMKHVGYGVAYDAMKQPYRPYALGWVALTVAALVLAASCIAVPSAMLACVAWALYIISVALWTALFFKGAHKVRMFPMYADDLNLDM